MGAIETDEETRYNNTRLEKLKLEIEKQISRAEKGENVELVERIYMYYDRYN